MTTKAKCPACGDTEGSQAAYLNTCSHSLEPLTPWPCTACGMSATVSAWVDTKLNRLHPDDIEAIAQRVVELMKG